MVGKGTVKCSKCGILSKENSSLTFHRFPVPSISGRLRARVWAKYCFPDDEWTSDESLVKLNRQHKMICSNHFDDSAFTSSAKTRMNKFAIPTEAQHILAQLRDEQTSEEVSNTEFQENTQIQGDEEATPNSSLLCSKSIEHLNYLQSPDLIQSNSLEQSEMSDSPNLSYSEDCEPHKDMSEAGPTTMLFCICCLQIGMPYVALNTCSHADFLNNFVMPELKPEDQVVCYLCHNMLKKIKAFKLQVEESFMLLSDSVETITRSSDQRCNLLICPTVHIEIPSTWKKRKLLANKRGNPQTKRKRIKAHIDNLITENKPKTNNTVEPQTISQQTKTGVENSFLPKIDKKTKNIETALKIININQNSGCIDLLASSLQSISYSLVSNMNNLNFGIGNQIGRIPTDVSFNNGPTNISTSTSNENDSINNTTTENNRINVVVDNQMNASTDILFSNNTPNNNATSISSENNTTEINNTNLKINNQMNLNPASILSLINTLTATKTTPISSDNITINNTIDRNEINIEDKLKTENTDLVENVSNEELDLAKDESMNSSKNNMLDEATVKGSPISSKIKQVTLTRDQLTEERLKMACSQAYLRLPHRCGSCLVGFQFKENLDDHVLRKHSKDKVRNPKQCGVCLQFVEACEYDKHISMHLIRYDCISCSKQFASYEKAAQHYMKLHCSAKPRTVFKCPQCPFKTQQMCQLKRHIRRVTKCKSCGDHIVHGCVTGITLNKHIARCKGPRLELNQAEIGPKPD